MVHLAHTSVHLTTMMGPIGLELATRRTVYRPSIRLANKNVLGIEGFQPDWVQRIRLSSRVVFQSAFHVDVNLGSVRLLGRPRPRPRPAAPSPMMMVMTVVFAMGPLRQLFPVLLILGP